MKLSLLHRIHLKPSNEASTKSRKGEKKNNLLSVIDFVIFSFWTILLYKDKSDK